MRRACYGGGLSAADVRCSVCEGATGIRSDMSVPRPRSASIRDVARLAGVSHQTVSRVLNGHPSVREDTKTRVLLAMGELQFRPSRAARMLSTQRSETIGILA